jgi:glycosyltransferase involved in cell wall biosynthesis
MSINIVIAVLNNVTGLRRLIPVLRDASPKFFTKIVVIDGYSNDGSLEYLQSQLPLDSRISLLRRDPNGIYDALNSASPEIEGNHVLVIGSDDFVDIDDLNQLGKEVNNPKSLYVFNFRVFENDISTFYKVDQEKILSRHDYPMIHHQSILIPADVFKRGFNIQLKIHADYEMICWAIKNYKILYVKGIAPVFFSIGGHSMRSVNAISSIAEISTIRENYNARSRVYVVYLRILLRGFLGRHIRGVRLKILSYFQ